MTRHVDAGKKGKLCYVTSCQAPGAHYWNASMRKYYCEKCANGINHWSLLDTGFKICLTGVGEPSYNELQIISTIQFNPMPSVSIKSLNFRFAINVALGSTL